MSDINKWLMLTRALDSAFTNIYDAVDSNNQLRLAQDTLEQKNIMAANIESKKQNITAEKEVNQANYTQATNELQESMAFLSAHNVMTTDYSNKVLKKFKTDDMQEILKNQGIEITDELEVRMTGVNTLADKHNKYRLATDYMNQINDSLNLMESEVLGLSDHLKEVNINDGIKGYLDITDITNYINAPENASMFKVPEYMLDPNDASKYKLNEGATE